MYLRNRNILLTIVITILWIFANQMAATSYLDLSTLAPEHVGLASIIMILCHLETDIGKSLGSHLSKLKMVPF